MRKNKALPPPTVCSCLLGVFYLLRISNLSHANAFTESQYNLRERNEVNIASFISNIHCFNSRVMQRHYRLYSTHSHVVLQEVRERQEEYSHEEVLVRGLRPAGTHDHFLD